jgi:hypothetical protein
MQTTRYGLKSLPTYYEGITFRSRLEARWAIVFDELGIKWEYEPEGIEIDASPTNERYLNLPFGYLPDFYLPEFGCIVEVKGHLNHPEYFRLMQIVYQLTGEWSLGKDQLRTESDKCGIPFVLAPNLAYKPNYPILSCLYKWQESIRRTNLFDFIDIHEYSLTGIDGGDQRIVGGEGYGRQIYKNGQYVDGRKFDNKNPLVIDHQIEVLCNNKIFIDNTNCFYPSSDSGQRWFAAIDKARSARFQDGHHA